MSTLDDVLADLAAESEQLRGRVAELPPSGWTTPTPAPGWTVAHQVAHLAWTDRASLTAITDGVEALLAEASADPGGYVDAAAARGAAVPPGALLASWDEGRAALAEALVGVPAGERIGWFGPPMSPTSMATARLMETWAHAHDVAEALGLAVPRTDRVRHVVHLGVRTRGFAYAVRGRAAPEVPVRVELVAPSGATWTWGEADAADRVTGDAWDFALLATRRRHRDDVDVVAAGPAAEDWLDVVQAFAGLPGPDPRRVGP